MRNEKRPWPETNGYPEKLARHSVFQGFAPERFLKQYFAATPKRTQETLEDAFFQVMRWKRESEQLPQQETVLHHLRGLFENVNHFEKECPEVVAFLSALGDTTDSMRWMFLVHDIGETKGGVDDIATDEQRHKTPGELEEIHKREEAWALRAIKGTFNQRKVAQALSLYDRFHNREKNPRDVLGHLGRLLDVMHGVQQGSRVAYPHRAGVLKQKIASGEVNPKDLPWPESLGHGDTLYPGYYIKLFENLGRALRANDAPGSVYVQLRTFLHTYFIGALTAGYLNEHSAQKHDEIIEKLIDPIRAGLVKHVAPEHEFGFTVNPGGGV